MALFIFSADWRRGQSRSGTKPTAARTPPRLALPAAEAGIILLTFFGTLRLRSGQALEAVPVPVNINVIIKESKICSRSCSGMGQS